MAEPLRLRPQDFTDYSVAPESEHEWVSRENDREEMSRWHARRRGFVNPDSDLEADDLRDRGLL